MYDFAKINRLTESDFTGIFEAAGGKRFSNDDSKEKDLNADYVIGNIIVELKLVEEEGFEKSARQQKLSNLFTKYNNSPVVVIDPNTLTYEDQRKYFNILEGPIKTHVKRASKQLKSTSSMLGEGYKKVLLIVNNGYSAFGIDEFKAAVDKRVKNDTSNIDYVISCGIYYYSDGFDSFVLAPFEIKEIYDKADTDTDTDTDTDIFKDIRESWSIFLNQYMTKFSTDTSKERQARLPVLDLEFEVNEVTFVKPSPPLGKESKYFAAGRQRINTSGIDDYPIVAMTFPKLSRKSWGLVKDAFEDSRYLHESYEEWAKFSLDEEKKNKNNIQPFVPVPIKFDTLLRHIENGCITNFIDLCNYTNELFNDLIHELISLARNVDDTRIELEKYILLVNQEIGRDKKNDLCSIYSINNIDKPGVLETLLENEQIFFEHGLSLASAYAIKKNIGIVLHYKDKRYAWT